MSRLILPLACLLALTSALAAQNTVGLSAGARLNNPTALSIRAFLTDEIAVEAMGGFRPHFGSDYSSATVRAAGFYHFDLDLDDDLAPLTAYVGAGAGLVFWNYDDDFFLNVPELRDRYNSTSLGLRGYVGAQYGFEDVPLEITLDLGPRLWFGDGWYNLFGFGYSLGVRYIISRR